MPFAIDTTNLTEWYSKIITLRLPQLTAEDVQIIAAAAAERALKYTQDHPYATAFAVIQIGLSPILGTGWVGTGILKIVGFGPLGPYAGMEQGENHSLSC